MIFVTPASKLGINTKLRIALSRGITFNRIKITCSNYYSVFIDSSLADFGPIRTSKKYARIKQIETKRSDNIDIDVLYYGFPSFDIELQDFFFGIELYLDSQLVATSLDFIYSVDGQYLNESAKYSFQRGLVERYDLSESGFHQLKVNEIKDVNILEEVSDNHIFEKEDFVLVRKEKFSGFSKVLDLTYLRFESLEYLNQYDLDKNFFEAVSNNDYSSYIYKLDGIKSGLFKIKISSTSKDKQKVFLVFDENYENDEWTFGRSNCNDLIEINLAAGEFELYSAVPYCLQYLMVLTLDESIKIDVELVKIENNDATSFKIVDPELDSICQASRNTFVQNSYDLFTDCPGRERAPWLCDSYFLSIAENYFTGKNEIEKRFLTNYLHQSCRYIPEHAFAMCYPSDHVDGTFIPNWGMWLILELEQYKIRSGDADLVNQFKDKVYAYYYFLKIYENELGLLENLPSWVFVEWSEANNYINGINFPTNILYLNMIKSISNLYGDENLKDEYLSKRKMVNDLSFFDGFYHDHALRDEDNKIIVKKDDISETCQYYALFFSMNEDFEFRDKMIHCSKEYNLKTSAVFIGKFLRYFWLLMENKKELILKEIKNNFYSMSKKTKTIWEKDEPTASMNHGFASCLAYLIKESLDK